MTSELIPEDFLSLIGAIVIQFNNIDQLLSLAIIELTGNDFMKINSHIPFANLQFGVKKIILDLLVARQDDIPNNTPLERYRTGLQQSLNDVARDRNAIAHSAWDVKAGTVYRTRLRAKGTSRLNRFLSPRRF